MCSLLVAAGLLLAFPRPQFDALGIGLTMIVLAAQKLHRADEAVRETGPASPAGR